MRTSNITAVATLVVFLVFIPGFSGAAKAALITVQVSGDVTSVPTFSTGVDIGDALTLTYTIDDALFPPSINSGDVINDAIITASVFVNNQLLADSEVSIGQITVGASGATSLLFNAGAFTNPPILDGGILGSAIVELDAPDLDTMNIPGTLVNALNALILQGGESGRLVVADSSTFLNQEILFGITDVSASVSEVPIPAALPLFVCGQAGLSFARRKRRAIA